MTAKPQSSASAQTGPSVVDPRLPRLGFLGVGWIGRNRLLAVLEDGAAEIVAVADPIPERAREAAALSKGAVVAERLEEVLDCEPDGVVIATPSALHAAQCLEALGRGVAVFCQKPLGRTAAETRAVVEAARRADRLLAADFCYRYVAGVSSIREWIRSGALGRVLSIDAVFHNAYGPDKAWVYDPVQSGGGCLMDLGIHLVDLALWLLDDPRVLRARGRLYAGGVALRGRWDVVEDYALAELDLEEDATVRLACSWNLHAGRDAVIKLTLYGTAGGAELRNVNGSFYDFTVERFVRTSTEVVAEPPDSWSGRAVLDWTRRLAAGETFDPEAERLVTVSEVLDAIYAADERSAVAMPHGAEHSAR